MAESKKKHKYTARVKVKRITGKTKWRYFYDMDEYDAGVRVEDWKKGGERDE